ncbi:MAG TPA: hypothetical protein VFI13_02210 [Gemmatimonadales bacterium]|nr:hypothetical protein [Gemmatimonadales bacterium]
MRRLLLAVSALALVAGCSPDKPKLPSMPAAFSALPLPPKPEYLGQSGSEDALMFTFRSPEPSDSVMAVYDALFAHDTSYHVVSSTAGATGEHGYYVEYHKRPLWIRIRPEAGNEGSIIELTGAVVSRGGDPADTVTRKVYTTGRAPSPN